MKKIGIFIKLIAGIYGTTCMHMMGFKAYEGMSAVQAVSASAYFLFLGENATSRHERLMKIYISGKLKNDLNIHLAGSSLMACHIRYVMLAGNMLHELFFLRIHDWRSGMNVKLNNIFRFSFSFWGFLINLFFHPRKNAFASFCSARSLVSGSTMRDLHTEPCMSSETSNSSTHKNLISASALRN